MTPDLAQKLEILTGAAKYDVSCASSGSRRPASRDGGLGCALPSGVCHSWSDDGRCISLFKILLTNICIHDCAYCVSRCGNAAIPRAAFTVEELVALTLDFYHRNYIEGLFLSSAVWQSADFTMERLLAVTRRLRETHNFQGYIHLKAIPGSDSALIRLAGRYCDRISVNIELPSEASLQRLAPGKRREDILRPMEWIRAGIEAARPIKREKTRPPRFAPAGQSTQMIVGASPEPDARILHLSEALYRRYQLKRIYFSAFVPAIEDPRIPAVERPDLLREHRLYQADWLMRLYGFETAELLSEDDAFLDRTLDPKTAWALRNLQLFPIEVSQAPRETLIRVPGIGFRSAARIIATRRCAPLRLEDLSVMGVVMRRARHFITCNGQFPEGGTLNPVRLAALLRRASSAEANPWSQPLLAGFAASGP